MAAEATGADRAPQVFISWRDRYARGPTQFEDKKVIVESFYGALVNYKIPVELPNADSTPLPKEKAEQLFAQILKEVSHTTFSQNISSESNFCLRFKIDPYTDMQKTIQAVERIAKQLGISYVSAPSKRLISLSDLLRNSSDALSGVRRDYDVPKETKYIANFPSWKEIVDWIQKDHSRREWK